MQAENNKSHNPLQNITPIGLKRLEETIPTAFSSFYSTFLSMIQGIALGYLFFQSAQLMKDHQHFNLFYSGLTLMVIIIIWHEYVLSTIEVWWVITWFDSFIPLGLGGGEIFMISYLNMPEWWFFAIAWTAFIGFCAYINYGMRVKKEYFDEERRDELDQHFRKNIKRGRICLALYALMYFVCGVCYILFQNNLWVKITLLIVIFVSLAFFIYRRHIWWKSSLILYGWKE